MQRVENLNQIKQQIVLLDEVEKRDLAKFLAVELRRKNSAQNLPVITDEERQMQLEWLKTNREKYAGKYVALSGNKLVNEGDSFRETLEKAIKKDFEILLLLSFIQKPTCRSEAGNEIQP